MNISFILVEPAVPENIGAAARAIKTMGFHALCLVNPDNFPNRKADIVAHASQEVLKEAKMYSSLKELVNDFDLLIATSAKRRRTNENYLKAEELPEFLLGRLDAYNRVGIVFGREESGLSNEEIRMCDIISYVTLANPYPSLNLSHAVMVYAFLLAGVLKEKRKGRSATYPYQSLQVLKNKVNIILEDIQIKQPHIIGPRIMERLSYLKREDISLLHSICNALLEKND